MARVVMFVLNDVRRDARVLREAATLVSAGHEVTVIGRPTDTASIVEERETRDGFEIRRVPVPGRFRRSLLAAGGGRGTVRSARAERLGIRPRRPSAMIRAAVGGARLVARLPVVGGFARGLDLLARWRLGTVAWGRAAALAAPAADIWHGHDLTGMPAAMAARRRHGGRLVFDAHELFLDAGDTATRPGWARAVLRRMERRAIAEADAVVTVNDGLAAVLRQAARPRRMVVVHNAPPAPSGSATAGSLREASPLRAAAGVPADAPVALYHGSFAPGRGVEVLAAAIREPGLETVHAVFLGEGSGRDRLEAAAVDPAHGGRIHVLPPVDPSEVGAWVAGADVGVMPIAPTTRNHRLSTPNKLFECLSAGVPVVASDFPGIREIVAGSPSAPLGVLVDPSDVADVARGIRELLAMEPKATAALRRRCLAAARDRWSWERESAGLVALYADLAPKADTTPEAQRVTFVLPSSGEFDSRTRRMATSLAERGHDVLVIARQEPGLPEVEPLAPGAILRRVDAGAAVPATPADARGPGRVVRDAVRIVRTALRTRAQASAARAVDRPAGLYHAMGFLALPVAIDLARRARAPFVYDARDLYAEGNNVARLPRPLRALFAWRERRWARRAAAVLTVNAGLAHELARRLGIDRPPVVLNAQATWTPPDPPPDRLRDLLVLPPATPLVLYHGGFMRDRGLPELIAAMRTRGLEAAHLVLLGDGPMAAELARLAGAPDLGDRVHLLPPVPPSELLEWVASADVGVMPNQPRTINERLSTPNKLFECLAAGTPVVSSDFPERRRIILDDRDGPLGAVCDPTSPEEIGAAVRSILALDPTARADLRARCRRAAAIRYDWDTQLQVLLRVYGRVTSRPW
ncbi:MAG TPA: glycosyltransferase [Candidatus Limnocylindrales bacterium]|nr:glycosyltransferase [Candidatus Limnocylindrales bacterium]